MIAEPLARDRDDLTGKRFGRLTAVAFVGGGRTFWQCKCDCGEMTIVRAENLMDSSRHKVRSCGCARGFNLRGSTFGRLTVLSPVWKSKGIKSPKVIRHWLCRCECGSEVTLQGNHLTSGARTTCGCRIDQVKPDEVVAVRRVWFNYRHHARARILEWSLTQAEFAQVAKERCYYCGSEPQNVHRVRPRSKRRDSVFLYSGVDRVDNSRGYVPGNVVPCCGPCNLAKGTKTAAEFISWALRIAAEQQSRTRGAGGLAQAGPTPTE